MRVQLMQSLTRAFSFLCVLFAVGACAVAAQADQPTPAPTINDFATCVAAGNPVLRTMPPKCMTSDGKVFVSPLEVVPGPGGAPSETCKDLCGDGVCQEIVCMAIGCPCAESAETCPQDCNSAE